MLKKLTVLFASGMIASAGAAYAASFGDVDADGDGVITQEEFAAAYPEAGEEAMTTADANGDGQLSEEEHTAAVEDGLLPDAPQTGTGEQQ